MIRFRIPFYFLVVLALAIRIFLSITSTEIVPAGTKIEFEGTVDKRTVSEGRQTVSVSGKTVWVPVYPRANLGDLVRINGVVYCPKAQFCSAQIIKADSFSIIEPATGSNPSSVLFRIRERLVSVYRNLLPKKQAQLMSGIVFGGSSLGTEFKSELADVGLSHVVAASGMNVTFFAGLAFSVFTVFRMRKGLIVVLGCTLLWFYCGLTVFDASVVCFFLMVTLTLIARAFGRNSSSWWGLGVAGYIMLWAKPELIRDFGFLLSFASMIGQISVSSLDFGLRMAWKFLAQSFIQNAAAILATFPIVIWLFGQFSLVTLFTNLLVVWTIEPLMILGLVAVIFGVVSQSLAQVVILPAGIVLSYFIWVVEKFSALPWKVVRIENPGWLFLIGYYLFLGGLTIYVKGFLGSRVKSLI